MVHAPWLMLTFTLRQFVLFQAVSELLPIDGVELIGRLPYAVEFVTPMSAAVAHHSKNPDAARSLLRFLTRKEMESVLQQHGLDPAST